MPVKQGFVQPHQTRLTNSGTRLDRREIGRTFLQLQKHQACTYGAATHKETLMAFPNKLGHLGSKPPELTRMQGGPCAPSEDSRSKLYYYPLPLIRHTEPNILPSVDRNASAS